MIISVNNMNEERDEDGLTAGERDIIDSIDFDKIAAEAAAKHDEIVASAVASAKKKSRESAGKTRNTGIVTLIFAILLFIGGAVALQTEIAIYLLIAGILMLLFSICMFSIARSNKKL